MYKPLPKQLTVKRSPIEGLGLYALEDIKKNSFIDALAQCSEGYDSKLGNEYTRFLCKSAFDYLERGIETGIQCD